MCKQIFHDIMNYLSGQGIEGHFYLQKLPIFSIIPLLIIFAYKLTYFQTPFYITDLTFSTKSIFLPT